jgi:hypothetical protein
MWVSRGYRQFFRTHPEGIEILKHVILNLVRWKVVTGIDTAKYAFALCIQEQGTFNSMSLPLAKVLS